jgi:ATP-dependent DNA helicase PIF1
MVQRQQVFPWQNIGMHANAAPTAPASKPNAGTQKENQRKRQRDSAGSHPQPPKRHHTSVSRSPVGSRKQPVEVIDLLDDDDGPPPPPLINREQRTTVYEQQPVRYPRLPNIGSQDNPLDLDSPPRHPQIDGAVDPASHFQKLVKSFNNTAAPPGNAAADIVPILEPTLCKEQADLVDLILSGRNVFYTGSAGCGKSTVLKAFVKRFAERGMKVNIIAPTGRAALDINGSTTWTYAGWTPDHHKKPLKDLRAGAHGKFVHKRLNETDVLVIDEVSMVENHHFERLNHLMKEARNNETAFGGVQIVVTGDFCQLPPVKPFRYCIECGRETIKNKEETEYKCRAHGTFYDKDKWAFRSTAWQESDFVHVNLTQIHRQSDRAFISILNKLRMGIRLLPPETKLMLNHESETRNAIQLFATRAEVNKVNEERFRALRSVERTYKCLDHFKWNEAHGNLRSKGEYKAPDGSLQALAEHRFESQIRLKKGMLIVLLHNLDIGAGLVNGSQGTIQGFEDYDPKNLPKSATGREKRDGFPMPGVQVLQGDHAVFREGQLQEYAKQMEFKAWPIVR